MSAAVPSFRSDSVRNEFERNVTSTRRRAYAMALQLTRNPVEAEDLVQTTMLKAWRGYEGYLPDKPFLNWLLRIMQRAYLDLRRRENPARRADSLNALVSPSDGETHELPIPDPRPNPEAEAMRDESASELIQALYELPEAYREAIRLCDLLGLSYAEIADAQGTTIGTVRSRIHRGRRMLRDLVEERGITLP